MKLKFALAENSNSVILFSFFFFFLLPPSFFFLLLPSSFFLLTPFPSSSFFLLPSYSFFLLTPFPSIFPSIFFFTLFTPPLFPSLSLLYSLPLLQSLHFSLSISFPPFFLPSISHVRMG